MPQGPGLFSCIGGGTVVNWMFMGLICAKRDECEGEDEDEDEDDLEPGLRLVIQEEELTGWCTP